MNKKANKANRIKDNGQWVFYCTMTAIPLIHLAIFYFYVNFNSIMLAFQTYIGGKFVFTGFNNFVAVFNAFSDPDIMLNIAFRNSIIRQLAGYVLGLPFGLIFSWYVYKKKLGAGTFKVILYLPQIVSAITMTSIFFVIAEALPIEIAKLFGVKLREGLIANPDTTFITILLYTTWSSFGGSVLMYSGTMSSISDAVIEAGEVDGVTPFREFISIVIPMIFPTISTFLVAGIATMFTDQMNLFNFFGQNVMPKDQTIGYYLYMKIKTASSLAEYPYLASLGVVLTCIVMPVVIFVRWLLGKLNPMEN